MRPRGAAVGRLQDAVAEIAVTGQRTLTGARVDHRVVRRSDLESARGERGQGVGARHPDVSARIHGPDPALRGAQDEPAVAANGQRSDAAADRCKRPVAALDLNDRVRADRRPLRVERRGPGR